MGLLVTALARIGTVVAVVVGAHAVPGAAVAAPAGTPLTGRLVNTAGEPVADVGVDVYRGVVGGEGGEHVAAAVTGSAGAWDLTVAPGRYTVVLTHRQGEYAVERLDPVRVTTAPTRLEITLGTTAPHTVSGRVVDPAGAPVAGATVRLFSLADRSPGTWRYATQAGTATTDADGGYRFTGSYTNAVVSAVAELPGYAPTTLGGHADVAEDPGLYVVPDHVTAPDLVLAPVSSTPPELHVVTGAQVVGSPRVGAPLAVRPPTFDRATDDLDVAWLRDGELVAGATGTTYRPTPADAGHRLAVRVTGARAGYWPAYATSAAVVVARAASSTRARAVHRRVPARARAVLVVRVSSVPGAVRGGAVTVRERGRVLAVRGLRGGSSVRVRIPRLAAGRHVLTAAYGGSAGATASRTRVVLRVAGR